MVFPKQKKKNKLMKYERNIEGIFPHLKKILKSKKYKTKNI